MARKIAFIGLGNMGGPMAANLVRKGFDVTGFDIFQEALARLAQAGGKTAGSAGEAARGADVVITMLPTGEHVHAAYAGEKGILAMAHDAAVLVDCSTVAPDVPRNIAEAAAAQGRGLAMLDAPVSGGTSGAAAGTLTFIVGGEAGVLEKTRGVFDAMGRKVFHAGAIGAGQLVKLCNNMLLGVLTIGTCEALRLGIKNGLDPKVLTEIMCQSSGQNVVLQTYSPCPGVMENVPSARGYAGGFATDLMLKDLRLASDLAQQSEVRAPLGQIVKALYELHQSRGSGPLDHSSVFNLSATLDELPSLASNQRRPAGTAPVI
ncbi:3-hydroxyisobutyrate dehydrogenase [Herbaspirillum chlorophenolicum]|uniref:3-hydroxyisobutyrate dehydrogenase n=1 Tax=Herbaspirillum chlorophenolicum TaxID=211589 RepID=A0ABW8ETD5_9BURK